MEAEKGPYGLLARTRGEHPDEKTGFVSNHLNPCVWAHAGKQAARHAFRVDDLLMVGTGQTIQEVSTQTWKLWRLMSQTNLRDTWAERLSKHQRGTVWRINHQYVENQLEEYNMAAPNSSTGLETSHTLSKSASTAGWQTAVN